MKIRGRNIARIDDGIYTHVKIDDKLYRVPHVIKALRFYARYLAFSHYLKGDPVKDAIVQQEFDFNDK